MPVCKNIYTYKYINVSEKNEKESNRYVGKINKKVNPINFYPHLNTQIYISMNIHIYSGGCPLFQVHCHKKWTW